MREVNWPTDLKILKIFLTGFQIQSKVLTDFQIQQLQQIVDSSSFWARILDFACNKSIFVQISDSGEILTTDLHILIHLPLKMKKRLPNSQSRFELREEY